MSDLTLKAKSSTTFSVNYFNKQHIPIIIENRISDKYLIIPIN